MIKILFFIETLSSGGAEKVLRTLVNNMDQTRFQITVMTVWPEDRDKYLNPGIRYRSVYPEKNRFNRLRYRLEAALNLTYPLHIKADYDIEVAYLECGPTKIMAGSTNKKAAKIAWVHCDLKKKESDPAAFAAKCRPWYSKFDKVVCVSQNVKESFQEMFGTDPEAVVLYNVNDEENIHNSAEAFDVDRGNVPVFASIGRLSHEKGCDRLVSACAKLAQDGLGFECWMIGDGQERHKLQEFVGQNNLDGFVRFYGFQNNPYPFISAADMIVCPSRFEGFSTVVTEALILGKPVVTTDCSGMAELLGNNEYGMIVDNSEDGIYHGLKTMLDQPVLLSEYGEKAALRGREFSKEKLVKDTENFFIQMLGE